MTPTELSNAAVCHLAKLSFFAREIKLLFSLPAWKLEFVFTVILSINIRRQNNDHASNSWTSQFKVVLTAFKGELK